MNISDQVIERIIELLRKIEEKLDMLERLINGVLSRIPSILGYIADRIHDAWNAMLVKLREFWDWFADKLSYAGDPVMLNNSAQVWMETGGKVARINDAIQDVYLAVDDNWTGRAASQYKQSIDPQRRANTSIMTDFAKNVSAAMSAMAKAITAFWVAVAIGLGTLIGCIITPAGATGTIFGAPAGLVILVGGIVVFLITAGGGVANLFAVAGDAGTTLGATAAGITSWPPIATK